MKKLWLVLLAIPFVACNHSAGFTATPADNKFPRTCFVIERYWSTGLWGMEQDSNTVGTFCKVPVPSNR